MKKPRKKKKLRPRLPIEAVLKLRGHYLTTRKGEKGYDRRHVKKQTEKSIKEEISFSYIDKCK